MGLADATRSPQVEVVHDWIELLAVLIGESVPRRDLITFEGELPVGLLASKKLNKGRSHRGRALLFVALRFQKGKASRTEAFGELAAPNARARQGLPVQRNGWNPLPGEGPVARFAV